MNEKKIIEAVLFAAGRPISSKEIAQNINISTRNVKKIIEEIAGEYETRDSPIVITKTIKDEYVMQLTDEYSEIAENYAPRGKESRALLKTLALIAYKQPIEQSKIINFRGTGAYKHIKELEERELIERKPKERTYILSTTKEFCEFYSLKTTNPEEVRTRFQELLGGKKNDEKEKTGSPKPGKEIDR
ncbi:MAG: SMC-Scp complex subunit ScpB [Candidatus Methanofastidiosia archaeon]